MTAMPPGTHPSPEEVDAVLDAGAASGGVAGAGVGAGAAVGDRAVASHVAACAECRQVAASLQEVRDLLHEAGRRPPPAPAGLDDRLGAAIARAQAERAGTVVPLAPHAGRRDERERTSLGGRHVPRWLAVAASAVVLGGAAVTATQIVPDAGTESATSSDAAGGAGAEAGAVAAPPPLATGTDYVPQALDEQVRTLLLSAGGAPSAMSAEGSDESTAEAAPRAPAAAAGPLTDPAGLRGCLEAIGAPGAVPLAVDLARWQGEDAAVIVLPAPAVEQVEVWVVARDCRPGADGLRNYQVLTP